MTTERSKRCKCGKHFTVKADEDREVCIECHVRRNDKATGTPQGTSDSRPGNPKYVLSGSRGGRALELGFASFNQRLRDGFRMLRGVFG